MPRRGENIYKRKDGRWEGRYIKEYLNGKAHYGYVYARTYAEVRQRLTEKAINETVQESVRGQPIDQSAHHTFEDISTEWLSSIDSQIKRSTYVKSKNSLKSYLKPTFSAQAIETISRTDVAEFCTELLEHGGIDSNGLSPKTITDSLSILRSIFKYATDEKGLTVANLSGISVKVTHKAMRVFSLSEQEKLEKILREDLSLCNLGILLCLYTGIRIGEVCALTWKDIDDTEQILFVNKTMQRIQQLDNADRKTQIIISSPKSNCSIRRIPLPDNIYHLLKCNRCDSDTYFLTGKSGKYVEPRTMENRFKKALKLAGIQDANFHSLRHTFATRCIELGFDVKSLSEILGHASVNITLNRYVHPSMELKQKNMNMLSALFSVK